MLNCSLHNLLSYFQSQSALSAYEAYITFTHNFLWLKSRSNINGNKMNHLKEGIEQTIKKSWLKLICLNFETIVCLDRNDLEILECDINGGANSNW